MVGHIYPMVIYLNIYSDYPLDDPYNLARGIVNDINERIASPMEGIEFDFEFEEFQKLSSYIGRKYVFGG